MGTAPPLLPPPEATGSDSIDDRIRAVEQRLLARERTLGLQLAHLGRRLHAATQPRRLVWSALGLAGALLAMWWLRSRAPSGRAKAASTVSGRPGAASLSWAPGLALAWPLLPASWRARVSPATATALVSLGAALMQRLLATMRGSVIHRSRARP